MNCRIQIASALHRITRSLSSVINTRKGLKPCQQLSRHRSRLSRGSAYLIHEKPLPLPAEFLGKSKHSEDPSSFIWQLHSHFAQLRSPKLHDIHFQGANNGHSACAAGFGEKLFSNALRIPLILNDQLGRQPIITSHCRNKRSITISEICSPAIKFNHSSSNKQHLEHRAGKWALWGGFQAKPI